MKKLIMIVLTMVSPFLLANELATAMYDNAEEIVFVKKKCGNTLGRVSTHELEPRIFKHSLLLGKFGGRRAFVPKCIYDIRQDYTPLSYDGPIKYKTKIQLL